MLKLVACFALLGQVSSLFDPTMCGQGKTCVAIPDGCITTSPSTCQQGISFKRSSASFLEVELFSNNLGDNSAYTSYMAIGFQPAACAEVETASTMPCMASAPVMECSALNGRLMSPAVSWNTADPMNVRIDNAADLATAVALSMSALENANGQTYCKLTQRITGAPLNGLPNANQVFQYNPTQKYAILMAAGVTNGSVLTHHPHPNTMVSKMRYQF
ncbi:unnamed protein product, partial [Mesorhabditis belari]|uniref:Uncharacterized protein n=1 Tax=Mesorhabditis belari TaxID=2138241 RepID=A0AAF3J4S2_9BILA